MVHVAGPSKNAGRQARACRQRTFCRAGSVTRMLSHEMPVALADKRASTRHGSCRPDADADRCFAYRNLPKGCASRRDGDRRRLWIRRPRRVADNQSALSVSGRGWRVRRIGAAREQQSARPRSASASTHRRRGCEARARESVRHRAGAHRQPRVVGRAHPRWLRNASTPI